MAGIGTTGQLAFVVNPGADADIAPGGFDLQQVSATGATTWSTATSQIESDWFELSTAVPLDVAAAADGHIALVGSFTIGQTSSVWIQMFTP